MHEQSREHGAAAIGLEERAKGAKLENKEEANNREGLFAALLLVVQKTSQPLQLQLHPPPPSMVSGPTLSSRPGRAHGP